MSTSIEGRIAVDVGFSDKSDETNVQSLKRLAIASATSYTSGKVAIVNGTCSTAVVSIAVSPTTYKDASGAAVSFSSVTRIAFAASPAAVVQHSDISGLSYSLGSRGGRLSVNEAVHTGTLDVRTTAGTAAYTLVIYGT